MPIEITIILTMLYIFTALFVIFIIAIPIAMAKNATEETLVGLGIFAILAFIAMIVTAVGTVDYIAKHYPNGVDRPRVIEEKCPTCCQ